MNDYGETIDQTMEAESQAAEVETSGAEEQTSDDGEQEAVETETESHEAEEEGEEEETEEEESEESDPEPKGVQKRIDELTKRRYDAERQTEELLGDPEVYRRAYIEKHGVDPFEKQKPEPVQEEREPETEVIPTPYDEKIRRLQELVEADDFYSDIEKANTETTLDLLIERRQEHIDRQVAQYHHFRTEREKVYNEAVSQFNTEVTSLKETYNLNLTDEQVADLQRATAEVGKVADAELRAGKRKEPITVKEAVEKAARILFFDEMASVHVRKKVKGKVDAQKEQMAATGGDNVRGARDVTPADSYEDAIEMAMKQHS